MLIICSGELYGEIDHTKCLECASDMGGLQPCGYGYKLLKSIFHFQEDRSDEIHVTDITGCLLRSYIHKVNPKPKYVHELLGLWIGSAIHKSLELNDDVVSSEVIVNMGELQGRVDTLYLESDTVEDTKTTRWLNPDNLPYGNHATQVQVYGAMLGGERLQIQYIDLSGPTRCRDCKVSLVMRDGQMTCPECGYVNTRGHLGAVIREIPVSNDVDWINDRVKILKEAMDGGDLPPAEESFLCGYCDHTECIHNVRF